ncbi:hypothetical protein D0C16_01465 [Cellvibrio sp. KY-GH-1]|uniref:cellulose binding domain-containing protein n=1 Tax=Cellvibrio sp. KY-GH-1 TaxID=2303332 RepID=UPI0012480FEF|nr:cellulose binding domain-containing protein [Cellvibrio sp. KY-GH-1]QEY14751.1 hypothetical protein D0C16_01465 [Cellvibrio sp. KY-GH-1]
MKKLFSAHKSKIGKAIAILSVGLLAAPAFSLSPLALTFWKVQDGKLIDPNGNPFVFRGVTINHTLAPQKTVQALKDIAAKGANSAQIEFAIQGSFPRPVVAELRDIIQTCKDNKLVCVLEPNDGSGYSETLNSVSPSIMAYYWSWNDLREVLNGAQGHIILGLSNQILGNVYSDFDYVVRMETYLSEFRANLPYGFMIMIDGNKWGQDSDKAMLQLAARNLQRGGDYANIIYSVDMFDSYTTGESVRNYISSFSELKAPLVIGGFAPTAYYHPYNTSPRPAVVYDLPEDLVMQYAEQYGVGYFGWSWSGNENSALDMAVNYNPTNLTPWGKLLFDGTSGIKATAKPASIYNSSASSITSSSINFSSSSASSISVVSSSYMSSERAQPSSSSSSLMSTSRSSSSIKSSVSTASSKSSSSLAVTKAVCSYVINSQWNNGFTASIRIKNTSTTAINGWDVNWQYSDGSKVTNLWNATLSGSNPYTAKNLSWNSTIQPGQTAEFGFQGTKSAATASVPVVLGSICQ